MSSLPHVFKIISDDVRLLQKQSHRVGKLCVGADRWLFQPWDGEQPGETDTHQPGHVVAVLQRDTRTDLFENRLTGWNDNNLAAARETAYLHQVSLYKVQI